MSFLLSVKKKLFFYLISERFWINACFDFGSPHMNTYNEICIFSFLAKWLFLSFDQTILRKKSGGGGLVALQSFGYLKRATRTFNLLRAFLLIKNRRKFLIKFCNELLYSCIFITYMRGLVPSLIPCSLH